MNSTKLKLPNRLEKNIVSANKLVRLVDSSHIGIVVPYNCRSPDCDGAPLIIHLDTAPNPRVATGTMYAGHNCHNLKIIITCNK